MIRKIIKIDEEKCSGCGACANACHEGAIKIIDGKARLTREDYCDGLGDCLPSCPTQAISFEMREAPAYDEAAVLAAKEKTQHKTGCLGAKSKSIEHNNPQMLSRLSQWPVQIKLVPVNAPYFENADLLIAADCTAYAYANFHNDFIADRITLIGCPKLDNIDYSEKLASIIANNEIKSITVVRMEVPCCGGIENAAKKAVQLSGKMLPLQTITISLDGKIVKSNG